MNEYGIFDNFMFRLNMISFAEYRKPDSESPYVEENEGGTYVHLFPEERYAPVRISKKNVLERFHTWLEECIQKNGISRELSFPVYCKSVTPDGKERWNELTKDITGNVPVNNVSNPFI